MIHTKGNGTTSDPYKIASAENLAWIINNHSTKYYKLTNHIDMSKYYWVPIGTTSQPFAGLIDGQGYTISGLRTISQNLRRDNGGDNSGFIGVSTKNATIKNIYFEDIEINGRNNVAGVVGQIVGKTTINSVAVVGKISGKSRVLGIAGYSTSASYVKISDCLLDVTSSNINIRDASCNVTAENATDSINYSTGTIAKTRGDFENWVENLVNMKYSMLPKGLAWIAYGK